MTSEYIRAILAHHGLTTATDVACDGCCHFYGDLYEVFVLKWLVML